MAKTHRRISYDNWTAPIMAGFNQVQGQWQSPPIVAWKMQLHQLAIKFGQQDWIMETIQLCKDRVSRANQMDVHPSEYFYTYRFLEGRLKQLEATNSISRLLPFNVLEDCQLKNAYHSVVKLENLLGMDLELDNWSAIQQTTTTDNRFLGKWENLFIKPEHQPDFLSWEALT